MAAVMMVFLVAMIAFAIDSGYMLSVRTELQRSADAGAMAGAAGLIQGASAARAEALRFVRMNDAGARTISSSDVTVELGQWNKTSKTFTIDADDPSAVRVSIIQGNNSVFFGRVLGRQNFSGRAEAIAVYKPRDIVMSLDYSGSMCFDSQLRSIGALGRAAVENNLRTMYEELGSPSLGLMTFTPVYISSGSSAWSIRRTLGLRYVAYPYPGGSWNDYIDYVQNDYYVDQAGYRNHYGYLTWINYLQARQSSYANTPDLWRTSEQPVTAVKDAVDLFVAYIRDKSPDDRLGLSIYTSANNTAILEHGLTQDYSQIATTVRRRQAGHYVGGTNIYDGMRTAQAGTGKQQPRRRHEAHDSHDGRRSQYAGRCRDGSQHGVAGSPGSRGRQDQDHRHRPGRAR